MSRPATDRLKVNPLLGMRPSLEFRRLHELSIDPSYQRSIEAGASQSLIRRIAQYWDWSLCQPLTVAKRADGTLRVVDGQHRLEAARLRRDIDDLPCVVTSYPTAGDEAAAFVALNQQRRPLSALDLFKAALAAEDTTALAIAALLKDAGLTLAGHSNYTAWKPGMVSNISGIQRCFVTNGGAVTAIALKALAKALPGQILRYAGTLFPGIAACVALERRVEGRIDEARLIKAISSMSQTEWREEIALEQAASGTDRRVSARVVVSRAYAIAGEPIYRRPPPQPPQARAPQAASPQAARPLARAPTAVPPGAGASQWCDQCDKKVFAIEAAACQSPFCKAKAVAA